MTQEEAAIGNAATKAEKEGSPEFNAWLPSKLLFIWLQPLFSTANTLHKEGKALEQDDLLPLSHIDFGSAVLPRFEKAWAAYEGDDDDENNDGKEDKETTTDAATETTKGKPKKKKGSTKQLQQAIFGVMGERFLRAGCIKFINTGLQFSFPLLLNQILKSIENTQAGVYEDEGWWTRNQGYGWSIVLLCFMASKAITENAYFHAVYRSALQARVAVTTAVYNKALRLSNAERQSTTLGELVNLMQVDATKIEMFVPQVHVLWDGLLQIVGFMTILYTLIGWPCLVGLVVMMVAGPVQGIIMGKLFAVNRQIVKFTDARVKTTNEALQGMQSVKMFAWEDQFARIMNESRDEELGMLRKMSYLRGFSRAYISSLPGLVAVVSFTAYALAKSGANISASTLFAALVAFDQLRFPLLFYPISLAQLAQASVSAGRVQTFLRMKEVSVEIEGDGVYERDPDQPGSIRLEGATVYWSDPSVPLVDDSKHSKSTEARGDQTDGEDDITTKSMEEGGNGSGHLRYPKAVLRDMTMEVSTGELCAVVGRVGSGKSTLCAAILNETLLDSGKVSLSGSVAYASQSPWILNASLRENILFGLPMDEAKYNKILDVCQLQHDLEMLDEGDLTEIGEKGINLSGGQKQRVSVARAAYADADTIILDDPLSALDPEVGGKLFEDCIAGYMKGKTRLLITNQLQFLKSCDTVVAIRHGRIIEQGRFTDLMASDKGEVSRLLHELEADTATKSGANSETAKDKGTVTKEGSPKAKAVVAKVANPVPREGGEDNKDKKEDTAAGAGDVDKSKIGKGALVTKEERSIGAVKWRVYKKYIQSGGGWSKFMFVYFGFILSALNSLATNSWVSLWTSDAPDYDLNPQGFYLGIYAVLAVSLGVFTFIRAIALVRFGVSASETLHQNLVKSVLKAPQSFFDTTPIGRILSRFSKDLYSIDIELTDSFDFFLFCSLNVIISLSTILFVTPWFGVAIVPLAFFYFKVLNYFREVSRETKRLESISRSPIYALFSETLGGLSTIRAYGEAPRFVDDFESKVDENTKAYYNNKSADRWLSVRLELIGSLVAGLAAVFATNVAISGTTSGRNSDDNFASLAGLSLTLAISITGLLNWCVRTFAQLEAAMNACERVLYYTDVIDQEAASTSKELEDSYDPKAPGRGKNSGNDDKALLLSKPSQYAMMQSNGKAETLRDTWPDGGKIVLRDLHMKYRKETPLVLKGLNVTIEGGDEHPVAATLTGRGELDARRTLTLVDGIRERRWYRFRITADPAVRALGDDLPLIGELISLTIEHVHFRIAVGTRAYLLQGHRGAQRFQLGCAVLRPLPRPGIGHGVDAGQFLATR